MQFAASNSDWLSCARDDAIDMSAQISITARFKASEQVIAAGMVTRDEPSNRCWDIQLETDGRISFLLLNTTRIIYSIGTFDDDVWHSVCATFDGTTQAIYADGELDNSATTSGGVTQSATAVVAIGSRRTATPLYYTGLIRDVRLYNRGLTADEARAIHILNGADHIRRGLVLHHTLIGPQDAVASGAIADSVGNCPATPNNSPTFIEAPFGIPNP